MCVGDVMRVGIKLISSRWEAASPIQVFNSISLLLNFLPNVVLSVDRWGWWGVDSGNFFLQCRRWEEVSRPLVGGDVSDSGRALVICQLLSEVGRLTALPGAISISCSLQGWPALSLEGGVAEGITWVASSFTLQPTSF